MSGLDIYDAIFRDIPIASHNLVGPQITSERSVNQWFMDRFYLQGTKWGTDFKKRLSESTRLLL